MKKIGIVVFTLIFLAGLTSMASAYRVFSNADLNNDDIVFFVENNGPGIINKIQFDLLSPFVFDGLTSIPPGPAGGTADLFEIEVIPFTNIIAKFGFDFTSFDVGDSFSFSWDPDIVGNATFTAVVGQLAGTDVYLFTTTGEIFGKMRVDGDHLEAAFCTPPCPPVPIPGSLLLLGSALIGLLGMSKKK